MDASVSLAARAARQATGASVAAPHSFTRARSRAKPVGAACALLVWVKHSTCCWGAGAEVSAAVALQATEESHVGGGDDLLAMVDARDERIRCGRHARGGACDGCVLCLAAGSWRVDSRC